MKKVEVLISYDQGTWMANLNQEIGYVAVASSLAELRELLVEGIDFHYEEEVEVIEIIDESAKLNS